MIADSSQLSGSMALLAKSHAKRHKSLLKFEKKRYKSFMQFRQKEAERNHQHELQMARIFASVLHIQNQPSGPFGCE